MQSPSLKKLGKRPELHKVDGIDNVSRVATPVCPPPPGVHPVTPQKRVLPNRSRRGGPGVGTCGVDMLIIDTERRTRETKPVIHPTQTLFLTTHSRAVPPPPETSPLDGEATGSYFDNPEVKAAYLAQRAIQVPEFSPLPDDAVGGRLRARAEEEGPETSDATYITRHRKYETFEKRQRRREKEKLVHEQYKLKERIEQLKGMDVSAFGGGGEARRKEMLDVAEGLEMRYAVLLPPDPKRMKKGENTRKKNDDVRTGTTTGEDVDSEEEVVEQPPGHRPASMGPKPNQGSKASTRLTLRPQSPAVSKTPVPVPPPVNEVEVVQQIYPAPSTSPSTRTGSMRGAGLRDSYGRFITAKSEGAQTPAPLPSNSTPFEVVTPPTPVVNTKSAPLPPRKRHRVEMQPKRQLSPEATSPVATSVLLQIAARKAAQPQARQTSRTTLAFGFRVPPEVEDTRFYELPEWFITQEELERIHEMRNCSTARSPSPHLAGRVPNGVGKHMVAGTTATTAQEPVPAAVTLQNSVPNGTTMNAPVAEESRKAALSTSCMRDEETEGKILHD